MTTRRSHGPAIRAIREALGITQKQLADSCSISDALLSRIESGSVNASDPVIKSLTRALGVGRPAITYMSGESEQ